MARRSFDQKMEAIDALRSAPPSEATADELRRALKNRNNFLVSKAAAVAGQLGLQALIPDLKAAFDHFMNDPVKSDPKCWAKTAIAKALKELGCDDSTLFIRGMKHVQMEPSYLRPEDTAVELRSSCALALVACPLPRAEILKHLVDSLATDPAHPVRCDAARAIAQIPGIDSLLLLRLKAQNGDEDPEVTGQCFVSLLEIAPGEYIPFVAGFLNSPREDVRLEAAAALGECHDPQAVRVLIERLAACSDGEMKRAILLSLGASREAFAADFLLSVASDGSEQESSAAIQALAAGRFRDEYRAKVERLVETRSDSKLQEVFRREFIR